MYKQWGDLWWYDTKVFAIIMHRYVYFVETITNKFKYYNLKHKIFKPIGHKVTSSSYQDFKVQC